MKIHAKIWLLLSAVALAALAALTACGSSAAPGTGNPAPGGSSNAGSSSESLHLSSTNMGQVLVNGAGMTLYFFDHDKPQESASTCTGPCASLWPAVTATGEVPAVAGVTGSFATITGVDGGRQLTLNGLPLYTYAGDKKAGDTSGQGYGGIWWVVDAQGAKVTAAPAPNSSPAPATPAPASPSTQGYSGSGY